MFLLRGGDDHHNLDNAVRLNHVAVYVEVSHKRINGLGIFVLALGCDLFRSVLATYFKEKENKMTDKTPHELDDVLETLDSAWFYFSNRNDVPHANKIMDAMVKLKAHIKRTKDMVLPGKFKIGDIVRKTKGSSWRGKVCGFYSAELTPIGYAVESMFEPGSVQIYPETALATYEPGVVLVPKTPTGKMLDAGFSANEHQYSDDPLEDMMQKTVKSYKAMIAAAQEKSDET